MSQTLAQFVIVLSGQRHPRHLLVLRLGLGESLGLGKESM